jgi:hypothetical protein
MAAFWLKGCCDGDPRIHSHVKIKGLGETGGAGEGDQGRAAWRMAHGQEGMEFGIIIEGVEEEEEEHGIYGSGLLDY